MHYLSSVSHPSRSDITIGKQTFSVRSYNRITGFFFYCLGYATFVQTDSACKLKELLTKSSSDLEILTQIEKVAAMQGLANDPFCRKIVQQAISCCKTEG